jgi:hypothetical protein
MMTAKMPRDALVMFKRLLIRNLERKPALRTPELVYVRGKARSSGSRSI